MQRCRSRVMSTRTSACSLRPSTARRLTGSARRTSASSSRLAAARTSRPGSASWPAGRSVCHMYALKKFFTSQFAPVQQQSTESVLSWRALSQHRMAERLQSCAECPITSSVSRMHSHHTQQRKAHSAPQHCTSLQSHISRKGSHRSESIAWTAEQGHITASSSLATAVISSEKVHQQATLLHAPRQLQAS